MEYSPPGSSVRGILQAKIIEWVVISFSRGSSISFPGDLPDPGLKPGSPALQASSLLSEPPGKLFNQVTGVLSTDCMRAIFLDTDGFKYYV